MRKLARKALHGLILVLRQPRFLAAVFFALVAGAIAANALLMQPRQHPAPFMITRVVEEAASPKAQPPAAPKPDALVLAVQTELRRTGYYSGPLDGLSGPQTRTAILAFEAEAGRVETGAASEDVLAAIKSAKARDVSSLMELAAGDAGAMEAAGTVAEEQPASASSDPVVAPDPRVAAVQHALAISAYGPVDEDGVLGPQTRDAIMRFQRDHDLPVTGEVSDSLIVELRAAGALQDG